MVFQQKAAISLTAVLAVETVEMVFLLLTIAHSGANYSMAVTHSSVV